MRILRVALAAAVVAAVGVGPAAADPTCVDGRASEASALRPHIVDPSGDDVVIERRSGAAHDLRSAWVSLDEETEVVTLHLRVGALPPDAALRHLAIYGEDRWVEAAGGPRGGFRFSYGWVEHEGPREGDVTSYPTEGVATGSVDAATGEIRIVLPSDTLPVRGAALPLDLWSHAHYALVGDFGPLVRADDLDNAAVCGIVLD